jgi:hypothetical protein
MTRHFDHLSTVEAIKQEYRTLTLQHHPDRPGGDALTMQEINSQYHAALQRVDGTKSKDEEGREHTYAYTQAVEDALINKLHALIAARVPNVADVFLIGTWIWIIGDTKPIKETLKELECHWHAKRLCWYWHPHPYRHRYNKRADFNDLAWKYGAGKLKAEAEAA